MSKLHYMPWYPSDYKADTAHLTLEEHGAYRLLLDHLWLSGGSIQFDDKRLSRRLGVTPARFRKIWSEIGEFFQLEDEQITHKRISSELKKAQEKVEKRTEVARRAAAKRWKKTKENSEGDMPEAMHGQCQPEPEGSGKPLNRVYHEPVEPSDNLDHAAEPVAPARESGGGSGSCSGEEKQLPLRFRLGEDNYQLWLDLRENLRRGGFSTFEIDQIKPVLLACDEGTFTISTEPLEGKRWEAVQEIALAEGLSFTLKARPQLKAISGGKA